MENFYCIYECNESRFRVYLNHSNSDLSKNFGIINRDSTLLKKFVLAVEAIKTNTSNKSQFNLEQDGNGYKIYAIKVDFHRFYSILAVIESYREIYICRYGKKESQQNTKKLTNIIESIHNIEISKVFS